MRLPHFTTRAHAIRRVETHLRSNSFPRLQMMLLVSYALLRGGLDSMALRYPLALAVAYLFFLGLLSVCPWGQVHWAGHDACKAQCAHQQIKHS